MLEAGTELDGKYRVVRRVGAGGVGTVYEAHHVGIGRRVAVKILDARHAENAAVVARFQREARAASAVGHENIVQVLDSGTHEGLPYIVMEYLRGESLAARRASLGTLPHELACNLVGQVLSALAAAHRAGIVHCDLKPDNVFLVKRGERDAVKLLDFGISKFEGGGSSEFSTRQGEVLGTPAYMAPEQWMDRRKVDPRADVFSAGVVLYQLLTGKLPFQAETDGHLLLEIVGGRADPPLPSAQTPGLPEGLDAVVLKALKRDREERYAGAREFLDALRPFGAADVVLTEALSVLPPAADPDETTPPGRDVDVDRDVITRVDEAAVNATARARARVRRGLAGAGVVALLAGISFVALRAPGGGGVRAAGAGASASANASPSATATATATATTAAATAVIGAPARAEGPARVRVELRGVPEGAEVRVDGARQEGAVFQLPAGPATRHVEVRSGAAVRALDVVADHDQVVVVDLAGAATTTGTATEARNPGAGAGASGAGGRARPGEAPRRTRGGVGALRLNREF